MLAGWTGIVRFAPARTGHPEHSRQVRDAPARQLTWAYAGFRLDALLALAELHCPTTRQLTAGHARSRGVPTGPECSVRLRCPNLEDLVLGFRPQGYCLPHSHLVSAALRESSVCQHSVTVPCRPQD